MEIKIGDWVEAHRERGSDRWDHGRVLAILNNGHVVVGWSCGIRTDVHPEELASWDGEQHGAPAPECTDE